MSVFIRKLGGLKKIWDEGLVSVVQGCGYPNPDRSHFSSMEYWHTATPYQAQTMGWVGRFADSHWPEAKPNTIVNIAMKQSLAVQAKTAFAGRVQSAGGVRARRAMRSRLPPIVS